MNPEKDRIGLLIWMKWTILRTECLRGDVPVMAQEASLTAVMP